MDQKYINIVDSKILVMGFTFKENCPDIRNTKVIDIVNTLKEKNCIVDLYDPWVNKEDTNLEYGIFPIDFPFKQKYDAIILAVAHDEFKDLNRDKLISFCKENFVLYDVKCILSRDEVDGRL